MEERIKILITLGIVVLILFSGCNKSEVDKGLEISKILRNHSEIIYDICLNDCGKFTDDKNDYFYCYRGCYYSHQESLGKIIEDNSKYLR